MATFRDFGFDCAKLTVPQLEQAIRELGHRPPARVRKRVLVQLLETYCARDRETMGMSWTDTPLSERCC